MGQSQREREETHKEFTNKRRKKLKLRPQRVLSLSAKDREEKKTTGALDEKKKSEKEKNRVQYKYTGDGVD